MTALRFVASWPVFAASWACLIVGASCAFLALGSAFVVALGVAGLGFIAKGFALVGKDINAVANRIKRG